MVERLVERQERSALSSPVAGKAVRVAFDGGRLTSDAGIPMLAEIEHQLGIAERLAHCRRVGAERVAVVRVRVAGRDQ